MATLTIRNVPAEVHRALRMQAVMHGHSAEAEVRDLLENTFRPKERLRMGDALVAIGRQLGLTNEEVELMEQTRDRTPAEPMEFEE